MGSIILDAFFDDDGQDECDNIGQAMTDSVQPSERTLFDNKSAYMSPLEVAELLGVSRRTVYRWVNKGEIPSVKVAGTRRISREEVAKLTGRKEDIHAKSIS